MSDTRSRTASIAERTRAVSAGAPVVAVNFLGRVAVFALGEQALLFVDENDERRFEIHGGAILAAASNGRRVITGGDDAKVIATDAAGASQTLATDEKRRWIDHVVVGHDDAVAWSAGKTAFVKNAKGDQRSFDVISTVGGLAFWPKGFRLAVSHYNGVSLWFPNAAQAKPDMLDWKGSHHGVAVSPDGKFVVTAMQEPMLHGWRVEDRKHMRMSGYASRVRSLAWTASGKWLATGGSDQLILWPFHSKDGPMGKEPRLLAPHASRLIVVACHPKQDVVAAGFADGLVLLVRIDDGAEILARKPGNAPVSALGFSADGMKLAIGCEDGEAGIVDLA